MKIKCTTELKLTEILSRKWHTPGINSGLHMKKKESIVIMKPYPTMPSDLNSDYKPWLTKNIRNVCLIKNTMIVLANVMIFYR